MLNFFKNLKPKKLENEQNKELLTKTASLLIHAAKIDHEFTDKERRIIKKAIIDLGGNISTIDKLIAEAEINEKNSNQILSFTKEVKNMEEVDKEKIIEALWTVVYSDGNSDMYEENLMRRLTGLLYLNKKKVGDIKERVKEKLNK